jgi:Flp pilus assembly protein TadD
VARLVALQGAVEVQRADSDAWVRVTRLDTALCAGDRLRTGALSRAGLHVQPETVVRVDQNTVITLNHSAEEIAIEFFVAELAARAANARSCGAGYFITRFPKKFKVRTPHMNAAVEGTEFAVETSCDATQLTVLEGQVSSQSVTTGERQLVEGGQSLASGAEGPGAITTVVRPADAVQWVLRYPRLVGVPQESSSAAIARAENLLQQGAIDEALAELAAASRDKPTDADVLALRAVIQVAKNDNAEALATASAARDAAPGNSRAWLALSYAQQAKFQLSSALQSAIQAQSLQTGSALLHARVAELLLALGRLGEAEQAARAAIAVGPGDSTAHSILGFARLAALDVEEARTAFSAAIEGDSFNALPRLGLGLAMIRGGALTQGREQLEIAVALDPSNALMRSYVGKAYYEENTRERDGLASVQYRIAQTLDPGDPTPWFYDAILKFSQSRPAEALTDLESSSALNDGRAVYRSRQLLDLDLAARSASQAVVYNELGLDQFGLSAAARSLSTDPGNGSAHRFLADMYAATARHEIARASELLQSQLRLPLGVAPLQSQLVNDVAFKSSFFGPATVGFNEFNSLFVRDDLQFQFFGMLGTDDTYGNQFIVNGLHGPVSFGLSQLATETDGYRENNDDSVRQYDGILQVQPSFGTSIQAEVTVADRESGDLISSFDPEFFSPTLRSDLSVDTQRLGLRQVVGTGSDLLVSVIHQDRAETVDIPDPVFPLTVITEEESWKSEIQYLQTARQWSFVGGVAYFDSSGTEEIVDPLFPFAAPTSTSHLNGYGYVNYAGNPGLPSVELGISVDRLESDSGNFTEVNPKLGIIWSPTDAVTLRAAAFRVLKRQIGSDQGLEPTQLAGLNQLYDDSNGTVSESFGIAADVRAAPLLFVGGHVSRRNLIAPFRDFFGDTFFVNQREEVAGGYVMWMPTTSTSLAFEPQYEEYRRGDRFNELELVELPLTFRFISATGFRFGATVRSVEQEGIFDGPLGIGVAGSDSFWLLDASIGYRLPKRMGVVTLEARNLLDEEFRFQEVDQGVTPRYVPSVQALLRLSISF